MNIENIDKELEMIKDLFDIEFGLTVKGDEIKGYNKGKIYLDCTNCVELAQAFLRISHYLQFQHPSYDKEKGWQSYKEELFGEP